MNAQPNRIAIIGAGAAGLTAAHTLRKRGYRDITLFERENRVGGKVRSLRHHGLSHELGAVVITPGYHVVRSLLHQYHIRPARFDWPIYIRDGRGNTRLFGRYLAQRIGLARAPASLQRTRRLIESFHVEQSSGFAGLDTALAAEFDAFAQERGIRRVAEALRPVLVGCGYGYYETVPAAYFLKFMPLIIDMGLKYYLNDRYGCSFRCLDYLPLGFQRLWEAMARGFDLRLNSRVRRITRECIRGRLAIRISNGPDTEVFQKLIIACPGPETPAYLSMDAAGRALFEQIRYHRYYATLLSARGLPRQGVLLFAEHMHPRSQGRMTGLIQIQPQTDDYIAYQLAERALPEAQLETFLRADIWRAGGRLTRLIDRAEWDYFPHVSSEVLRGGFYDVLDRRQGEQGTYFVGGLMNFESVENTAAFAQDLIIRHFPRL